MEHNRELRNRPRVNWSLTKEQKQYISTTSFQQMMPEQVDVHKQKKNVSRHKLHILDKS